METATHAGSDGPALHRLWARARLLGLCLFAALIVVALRGSVSVVEGTPAEALAAHLARRGLTVDPDHVHWLGPEGSAFTLRPAVFVAEREGQLGDVYYADVRASSEGPVLDVLFLTNLTRSSSAAEEQLVKVGERFAFAVRIGAIYDAIVVLDASGEDPSLTQGWPRHARLQNAITNLQETGRTEGFGRRRYQLVPPARSLEVRSEPERFVVRADGERIVLDPDRVAPVEGRVRVRVREAVKGRPGTVTWLVDTIRNLSFVGPEPIEWLEHTVFGLRDRATRAYHRIVGDDAAATEAEVREALAMPELEPERKKLLTVTDPELGWPPAPLQPLLEEEVRGEGEWLPVVDDPFVNQFPNAPPAFYQTFIRVDGERPYTRVYITMWDPRQVQLHVAMGTREPESATGETGSGMIPRDPELLGRLVGAFNGGFQALHGEFGMMSEGRVYLPPKPYAATVAVFEDGRVGVGSWPGPGRGGWDEESANAQIPANMVAMRQNLTSVVEGERYNPWKRWWWGAAPEWAEEQTYIHRSGVCVTGEGHMAYFWGESMGPRELGESMIAARCERGLHLDMNSKHTGLEFYRPIETGPQAPAPLAELDEESQFEGAADEAPGFRFRARKAVKTMTPLRFPRYLGRDPRDFFFMSLRPVLPGPELAVGTQRIPFETAGLPHAGWPAAFARAQLASSDGTGSWLVRIDPTRAVPEPVADESLRRVLARIVPWSEHDAGEGGEPSLAFYVERGPSMLRRYRVGPPPAEALRVLTGPPLAQTPGARAALALDAAGFLLYAEADPGENPEMLALRMQRAGAREMMAVAGMSFVVDGKLVAVDGAREVKVPRGQSVALMAEARPRAEVLFPEVKPRPYRFWGWLQDQRVRYFPTGEPRFKAPPGAVDAQADAGAPE